MSGAVVYRIIFEFVNDDASRCCYSRSYDTFTRYAYQHNEYCMKQLFEGKDDFVVNNILKVSGDDYCSFKNIKEIRVRFFDDGVVAKIRRIEL